MLDFGFRKIGMSPLNFLILKLYDPQEAAGMFAFKGNIRRGNPMVERL